MRLEPKSLILVVAAGLVLGVLALRAGWPVWFAHVGVGISTAAAVIGYARWDERHRP
jgi:hypothetical protein